jgi:ATP-binding cassette subfamily C protein LapB
MLHKFPGPPATPNVPVASRAEALLMDDPALSGLLSRLASLLGHAVPSHRFGMVEYSQDGVEMAQLARQQKAIEMWKARFSGAPIRVLRPDDLDPGSFPLLWIGADEQDVRLVRGRLSHGACSTETADGLAQELGAETVASGTLLLLRADAKAEQDAGAPRSATDWFAFAIRKHRRIFAEAIFATFMISSIGLVSAMYTMQVYDRVVPTKGYSTLWVLTAGVLLAIVLEFTMKQVRAHMTDRASKAIDQELSGVFFGKALGIRMDARPNTVGTFASQIRHFESVRNFMTSSTLFILADAPFALLFIGVMALIAGPVAIVPLVMVPVAILTGLYFRNPIERLTGENMAESNRKNGLLIEAVDGIESIKAAGGEWKMQDRYRNLTATIAVSELKLKTITGRATNLAQSIQQLNYVGLIVVGAYAISTGQLTMGGLIACSIISGRALGPLAQIPQLIVQWQHAKTALKSLDAIMAMPSDRSGKDRLMVPDSCAGQLQMDKAVFAYREDQPTLEVAALSIQPGERIAVLGAVGSGKSTLIKMLSGLYKPKTGSVLLDGIDMDQLAPEFVREHIGYLPQDVRLFNGTLRDNLTLGLPAPNDSLVLRAARLTGLDQVIQNHPKGLELEINEGGRGLSGGQRQLVGLTRLLLAQPRIMLLDEPSASMDIQLEARVMKHLFEDISPESVLVVVTHKMGLLPHVNRIIVVDKGRIVADGPRDEILARMKQPRAMQPASPSAQAHRPVRAEAATA